MSTFEEKVKTARAMREMTQSELANAVGVSLRTILSYEKGEKKPRQSTLLLLAKALNVSTKYLTDPECDDPQEDIEKDGFIEAARSKYGAKGGRDIDALLSENEALFAGGELSQDQKDAFFEAIMTAYVTSKEAAKEKFGRKNKSE